MPVLSANNLQKKYGELTVVAGVNFAVESGECFGLLGPNGAGKTTTLRLCLGLIDPDSGSISLFDKPVPQEARSMRYRVGVVPQTDNLDQDFTVRENLLVYGRYFGLPDSATVRKIPELLEFAGLSQRADEKIQNLSGGMKRRLALARALVNDPDLIFLDEPTTGLDPQARHVIWQRLRQLLNQKKTIVLTTHFMEEAERLCTRVSIMDGGLIVASGSPRELINQCIEPQVVEVFGEDLESWVDQYGANIAERFEHVGESVFCYMHEAGDIIASLITYPTLRYMHRPANLEDVFLKLTGRELRD